MKKITIHNADGTDDLFDDKEHLRKGMGRKRKMSASPSGKAPSPVLHGIISEEEFNQNLAIGSVLWCRIDRAHEYYQGKMGTPRPVVVQALWRDQEQKVKKIEVVAMTSRLHNIFPSDMVVTEENKHRFGSKLEGLVRMDSVYLMDNEEKYFPRNPARHMDPVLWRDLLARRVYAITNSRLSNFRMTGEAEPGLTREGFTFKDIPMQAVRNGIWAPDMPSGDFARIDSPVVVPDLIKIIAEYAVAHVSARSHLGIDLVYPPFKEWDLGEKFMGFKDWHDPYINHVLKDFKEETLHASWARVATPELIRAEDLRDRFAANMAPECVPNFV